MDIITVVLVCVATDSEISHFRGVYCKNGSGDLISCYHRLGHHINNRQYQPRLTTHTPLMHRQEGTCEENIFPFYKIGGND